MGELRDNFKKAMSDMFGVGAEQEAPKANVEPTREATPTEKAVEAAIKASQNAPRKPVAPVVEETPAEKQAEKKQTEPELPKINATQSVTDFSEEKPEPARSGGLLLDMQEPEEATYISKSTTIVGNIQSGSDLHIKGKVVGDIDCDSDVKLWGKLEGNLSGKSGLVQGGQIVGNVEMRGDMYVADDAHIKGDVQCNNLDLNSAVDGNLRVQHKSSFRANATVVGNITTQTLVVEEGAMIEGYISMKDMRNRVGRPRFDTDNEK